VTVNRVDGIPQGGVRFRHSGFPVVVKVAVPPANAKYPSPAPMITAGLLIEIVDHS